MDNAGNLARAEVRSENSYPAWQPDDDPQRFTAREVAIAVVAARQGVSRETLGAELARRGTRRGSPFLGALRKRGEDVLRELNELGWCAEVCR